MFVMSVYALGTATVAVTSFHREQIMAARILNYVYVGMELGVVPTFQSEIGISPPQQAGTSIANNNSARASSWFHGRILPTQPRGRRSRHQQHLLRNKLTPRQPRLANPSRHVLYRA